MSRHGGPTKPKCDPNRTSEITILVQPGAGKRRQCRKGAQGGMPAALGRSRRLPCRVGETTCPLLEGVQEQPIPTPTTVPTLIPFPFDGTD